MKKPCKLYTSTDIGRLIDRAAELGYDVITIAEGVLGHGHVILRAPAGWWNVEITEVYVNCWTSGHKVRRCKRLSKRQIALIDAAC